MDRNIRAILRWLCADDLLVRIWVGVEQNADIAREEERLCGTVEAFADVGLRYLPLPDGVRNPPGDAAIGGVVGAGGGTLYGLNQNKQHDERYRAAYALTPNRAEFEAVVGPCKDEPEFLRRLVSSPVLPATAARRPSPGPGADWWLSYR